MRPIRADLWEARADSPFPGLTTHAYLWTGGLHGNVLFYGTQTEEDFEALDGLGGVAHQYLSHRDEAGPTLEAVQRRFGAQLHAPAAELAEISQHAHIDVPLAGRHIDGCGIEVIPTPGHTPGSTCYLASGANGQRYLFTGDTIMLGAEGDWIAGYIPSFSKAEPLEESLRLLATLRPDLVISSASPGDTAVHAPGATHWAECVRQARSRLAAVA